MPIYDTDLAERMRKTRAAIDTTISLCEPHPATVTAHVTILVAEQIEALRSELGFALGQLTRAVDKLSAQHVGQDAPQDGSDGFHGPKIMDDGP